jgi:hypothetical protein
MPVRDLTEGCRDEAGQLSEASGEGVDSNGLRTRGSAEDQLVEHDAKRLCRPSS